MSNKQLAIDLLILDFDGTIADSIPPAIAAIQAMVAELGLPYKSVEEINQGVGYGEAPLVLEAIGNNDPTLLKAAMASYFKHYAQKGIGITQLFPHTKEFLEHFKDKIKIVVSNKRDEFIKLILARHHLSDYFEEIIGGETLPYLKPDPRTIFHLLKKYNVPAHKAIMIGDMVIDVDTGKNSGIHTCAVTYGFHDRAKLAQHKPDLLVDDLIELQSLIV